MLRRVLHAAPLGLGHPMWAEADDVDLRKHIRQRRLPGDGGRARLDALVGKLHAEPLPREQPLWQFVVIENVEPGVVALYSKIHHALLDGQGGIALAQALLDLAPTAPRKRAAQPRANRAARAHARARPGAQRHRARRCASSPTCCARCRRR